MAQAPNVIVIISDDAGYADFGFMDGLSGETSQVPTPNLDALAARGVKFSSAYTAMVCSPSRAALTTGGYQQRVGYEFNINNLTSASGPFEGLPVQATTIWERMKSVGYTTGAVGKWHVGSIADTSPTQPGNRPENQGVDEFYGLWRGSRSYSVGGQTNETRVIRETLTDSQGNTTDTVVEADHAGEYITETFGQYAVDFIADHHNDTDPFFLYQAFTAPHGPLNNSPDFNDPRLAGLSGNRKQYASMMLTMDDEIGRILDRLDDPNGDGNMADSIADDTMVIFINDNGGASGNASDNGQLRGFKDSPYEGGMRVPMIIAGAGVDQSVHGSTYDAPVHSIDILPTAFAAGGGVFGPQDTGIDGVNLLPHINGQTQADPHESIVVRMADEVGVRKGDWKLVKNGAGSGFELYDLAADIGESTNVAGANPVVLADLQRALTDHEAEFDKPRFAKLNSGQGSVNIFDHFTFRPDQGGAQPGANVLLNPGFEDGATIDGSSFHTFEELSNWSNNDDNTSPAKDEVAARNDNAFAGAYRGLIAGDRTPYQVSSHAITLGEQFSITLAHSGQFSQWDVGSDSINMELFYLDGGGNEVVLDTINVVPAGSWTTSSHQFAAITDANAVGRLLGIRFDSLGGNNEFAGLDEIQLGLVGASSVSQLSWSASGAWFEGGTSNGETMFQTDAFAGAVLEFPTLNGMSYVSTNDMTRSTGLEFMLNKVVLSGSFTGAQSQTGTIDGNDLLFTDSLSGVGPQIALDATNSGVAGFAYTIDANVVLYDNLTITGNGDASLTISGVIRDYFEPRGLTKTGTSTARLSASNTYSGDTTIAQGTLALVGGGEILNSANIRVEAGATLDASSNLAGGLALAAGQTLSGDGTVIGAVSSPSGATVSPGASFGLLTISGSYSHGAGANLLIELGPGGVAGTDYDQLNVSGPLTLLGGDLTVQLASGFNPVLGDVFNILQFSSASGVFDTLQLPALVAGLTWDSSQLTVSGVLSVVSGLQGDFNGDGFVDAGDYAYWRNNFGGDDSLLGGNGDGLGIVDASDLQIWRDNFGASIGAPAASASAVPEPTGALLLLLGCLVGLFQARSLVRM